MTWAWAWTFDVGVDGDVAVGAAKIPDRTSGGWYQFRTLRSAGRTLIAPAALEVSSAAGAKPWLPEGAAQESEDFFDHLVGPG